MRRTLILVYSSVLIIILANYISYRNLYNKQINYIVELLERQVQIVGLSVDSTNSMFLNDLNQKSTLEGLNNFFKNPQSQYRTKEKMKLIFSKYETFITGIKLYDNDKNEFTLKKDIINGDWLEQTYILHVQPDILNGDKLIQENRNFEYYIPVLNGKDTTIGNLIFTIDFQRYFTEIFSVFNLKDYQWQWVINSSGEIIYDVSKTKFSDPLKIAKALTGSSVGSTILKAVIDGKEKEIVSSYYSTQLLQREFELVFFAKTDLFHQFIFRNSLLMVLVTTLLVQIIIAFFWYYFKSQRSVIETLTDSEKLLYKLIDEMPAGVIIYNKNREIIKANKVAAGQYSYSNENEMIGKIFPEISQTEESKYFSKMFGSHFNPENLVVINKEKGEMVLYRNTIPIFFMKEEADLEILIDVTMIESARKQEAKANVAKSEFLSRMSYEIRTPLNGIIGMTDILGKYNLSQEIKDILNLLNRSTEVLLNIINEILDFSRIESGRLILDEVPFNLREEINYCIVFTKTNIPGNDLNISYSVTEDVPESIIGDPFRLRQVLMNLLSHSVNNTKKGEIRLGCMLKSKVDGMITLRFELLDTGRSFDKVSLKKIFADFINIESKAVCRDESGFGTILSKQLIELMGGELVAESPSGIAGDLGTKVSFTITIYSNDRPIKDISLTNINSFEKINTLVITGNQYRDDEVLTVLHKLGLNVSITTFMKSTVSQIRENQNSSENGYNLIVIFDDKEFNGFEPANIIWDNNLSSRFILIMISTNDKKGNYLKCITMGVDYYIVKPFDNNEIQHILLKCFPFIQDFSSSFDINTIRKDLNILIVEDNKMNQIVIGTMLKSLGYTFDIVDNGYEGYIQAKSKKFDLIFMDLIMPEMDGFESAQKILKSDKSILIVAFTADNMPESRRKAELAGIRDFISKPVRVEDLKKLFAKYFKNN